MNEMSRAEGKHATRLLRIVLQLCVSAGSDTFMLSAVWPLFPDHNIDQSSQCNQFLFPSSEIVFIASYSWFHCFTANCCSFLCSLGEFFFANNDQRPERNLPCAKLWKAAPIAANGKRTIGCNGFGFLKLSCSVWSLAPAKFINTTPHFSVVYASQTHATLFRAIGHMRNVCSVVDSLSSDTRCDGYRLNVTFVSKQNRKSETKRVFFHVPLVDAFLLFMVEGWLIFLPGRRRISPSMEKLSSENEM